MTTNPGRLLASLRDVAWVEGSWLLGMNGQLVARDLSDLYSDEILAGLGPRLFQMTDVAADHLAGYAEDFTLRFRGRALHLRRAGSLLLVVMTLPTTNYQSLRIGAHLIMRQLTAAPTAPPAPSPAALSRSPDPRRTAAPPRPASPAAPRPAKPSSDSIWGN